MARGAVALEGFEEDERGDLGGGASHLVR